MLQSFVYEALPSRVVFGVESLRAAAEEAERLKLERIMVLTTPEQRAHGEQMLNALGSRGAALFAGARMHTPVDVTEEALAATAAAGADGLLAVGGGSTTGLGKAIALRTGLPQIVVPTTYAGSEMTPILGETRDAVKTTIRDLKVLPEVVIYDVSLTLGLPTALSVTSGLNAMAHAAEALYAKDRNPIIALMAADAIRSMAGALPRIVKDPSDRAARTDALYGAWLGGVCLGAVGMALHHKLCHTLGGAFDLPHAETHAVVLPHALAFNLAADRQAHDAMAAALSTDDPALALHRLALELGAPTALRDLGMPQEGIEQAADLAVKSPYWNPRPVERDDIKQLLTRAWAGQPPQS